MPEQPAPAPHLAHPEGCTTLRIVLVTVPRFSRCCKHFPDKFDLHLHYGEGLGDGPGRGIQGQWLGEGLPSRDHVDSTEALQVLGLSAEGEECRVKGAG